MVARCFQELTVADNFAGNGRHPEGKARADHKEAKISMDSPMPKTIGEAIGTISKQKHCASKLHLRPTLTIPTCSHAAVLKKCFRDVPRSPQLDRAIKTSASCARSSVLPHLVRGGLAQSELASAPSSLAAHLLEALLHVDEIRILVNVLLRIPVLLLELQLVGVNLVPELRDLLLIALLGLLR